jgi:membrane protein
MAQGNPYLMIQSGANWSVDIADMEFLKSLFNLGKDTIAAFFADRATIFAAGLAYFTIFALAPLLVIMVSVAGLFIGRSAAGGLFLAQLQFIVGPEVSDFIGQVVESQANRTLNTTTTFISIIALLIGATGIFNQLKIALNTLWAVSFDQPSNLREWLLLGKRRIMPLLMVFLLGLLLAISVMLDTILGIIQSRLEIFAPEIAQMMPTINRVLVPFLTYTTFLVIYKVLPDATTRWRDIGLGALVSSLLFLAGRYLLSLYLRLSGTGSIYGAAGSIIILLIWIYFSAAILLLGAEFIKIYADRYGKPIRAKRMAVVGQPSRNSN